MATRRLIRSRAERFPDQLTLPIQPGTTSAETQQTSDDAPANGAGSAQKLVKVTRKRKPSAEEQPSAGTWTATLDADAVVVIPEPKRTATKKAAGAKKLPAQPAGAGSTPKAAFILARPQMSASEIVAAARQDGITLSANYVYALRGKQAAPKAAAPAIAAPRKATAPARQATSSRSPSASNVAKEVARLVGAFIADVIALEQERLLEEARERLGE